MLSTIERIKTIFGNDAATGAALLARVPPPRKTKTNYSRNRGSQSPVPDARRRHAWKMNPKFSPSSRAFDTCRWFISNASSRRDDRDLALSWAGVWLFQEVLQQPLAVEHDESKSDLLYICFEYPRGSADWTRVRGRKGRRDRCRSRIPRRGLLPEVDVGWWFGVI